MRTTQIYGSWTLKVDRHPQGGWICCCWKTEDPSRHRRFAARLQKDVVAAAKSWIDQEKRQ
jgi:hypothetical protein